MEFVPHETLIKAQKTVFFDYRYNGERVGVG
jgi:hypothetical protein